MKTRSCRVNTPKKVITNKSSDTDSDSTDDTVKELALNAFDQLRSVISDEEISEEDDDDGLCCKKEIPQPETVSQITYDIDKKGEINNTGDDIIEMSSSSDEYESDELRPQTTEVNEIKKQRQNDMVLSSTLQPAVDMDCLYLNTDIYSAPKLKNKNITELFMKSKDNELLRKSVVTSDFEKKAQILPYRQGIRQLKKQRRLERDKTNGRGWFHMPAPDVTEEKKNDLLVLQMRRALDPKRFYKAPDRKGLPKYFQTGRIIESAADFYHSRIPKKQRKETIVDELLADVELKRYNKKKYKEIMEEKMKRNRGAFKHMRRQKKKKK